MKKIAALLLFLLLIPKGIFAETWPAEAVHVYMDGYSLNRKGTIETFVKDSRTYISVPLLEQLETLKVSVDENNKTIAITSGDETVNMTVGEKEYKKEQLKRQNGIWKTSWQWLAQDKRKVKDKAIPISKFNWIFDDFTQEFYQKDEEYYYYSQYDTEEVTEEEYNKLKKLYIKLYGGWEIINLEDTEYNGKKWY